MKDEIVQIIKNRNIKRISCFHCDHFEPGFFNDRINKTEDIRLFVDKCKTNNYSKRISLFIPIYLKTCLIDHILDGDNFTFHLDNDKVLFYISKSNLNQFRLLLSFVSSLGYDIHIHIHHENWTSNEYNSYKQDVHEKQVKKYVNETSSLDSKRFELVLKFHIKIFEECLNKKIKDWFFIHGHWSLNASDPKICNIKDEIQILHRNGCIADFSFPSGKDWSNPKLLHPHSINPLMCYGNKDYDNIEKCEAKIVGKDKNSITKDRFIIWNSPSYDCCSLDKIVKKPDNHNEIIMTWFQTLPVIHDTLYIRTFSHSLSVEYWDDHKNPMFPLIHNNTMIIFNNLEQICKYLNVDLQYIAATDAINNIKKEDKV